MICAPDPAAAGSAAAWHPRTGPSALPAHPATATARTGRGPGGPEPHPDPRMPVAAADKSTQETAAPGQRLWPGPGADSAPARPA